MHDRPDIHLLRDYAATGSEAAFRELVARHTDFVFSAALRQVGSPDLAADLAQGVFTDLARKARPVAEKMPQQSSLAGWLHRSTRYAALNHLRDTRRRQSNERQAMEQLLTNTGSAPDWELIRPVLDEALDSLGDEDREALLLRYFKNQDFRAVGLALGISDDTAQKRVSRALERLREFFSKTDVAIGASGLAVLLSANAVQAAPVGLTAAISAAAVISGTTVSTSTAMATTKILAMTTLQKTSHCCGAHRGCRSRDLHGASVIATARTKQGAPGTASAVEGTNPAITARARRCHTPTRLTPRRERAFKPQYRRATQAAWGSGSVAKRRAKLKSG